MEALMGGMSAGMSWLAPCPGSPPGEKDGQRSAPAALPLSAILSPEATRLGKAGPLLFYPGAAGARFPWGSLRAEPGCHAHPPDSSGAGDAPSKPVLSCGVREQT